MSPLTAKQAKARAEAVGASEVGALVGDYRHPYSTPASIYARITAGIGAQKSKAMTLGQELEPALIALAGRRLGIRVRTSSWTYRHRRVPLVATVDAVGLDEYHDREIVVEAKLVGQWASSDWSDGPPPWVVDQVQAQLALSGRELGVVAALIGGTRFELFELPADCDRQRDLIRAVEIFAAAHLAPRLPPLLDDRDDALVLDLAPLGAGEVVATGDALEAAARLDMAARMRLDAEALEAAARAQLERELAASGASVLVPPFGSPARWRASVVDRDGRRSMRFLPSRASKDAPHG